jgi:cytochrome c2
MVKKIDSLVLKKDEKILYSISQRGANKVIDYLSLEVEDSYISDSDPPKILFEKFCGQCHSLQRAYSSPRSKRGWQKTVSRMVEKSNSVTEGRNGELIVKINKKSAKKIVNYLVSHQKFNHLSDSESPKILFGRFCSQCHSLQRAYSTLRSKKGWQNIVNRMLKNMNNTRTNRNDETIVKISERGADKIIEYLVSFKKETKFNDTESTDVLFEQFCSQCHSLNRVYSVHRNRNGWKKLVDNMLQKVDSTFLTQKNQIIKNISKENAEKISEYLYLKLGASTYREER